MSDHGVMRRRLASVDEAIRVLSEEWKATEGGGYVPLLSNRIEGDARKASGSEGGECWLSTFGVVLVLREIRGTLADVTKHTEEYAALHGPQNDWVDARSLEP